jgi:hypothetical protein
MQIHRFIWVLYPCHLLANFMVALFSISTTVGYVDKLINSELTLHNDKVKYTLIKKANLLKRRYYLSLSFIPMAMIVSGLTPLLTYIENIDLCVRVWGLSAMLFAMSARKRVRKQTTTQIGSAANVVGGGVGSGGSINAALRGGSMMFGLKLGSGSLSIYNYFHI